MPSAAPDARLIERFRADLEALERAAFAIDAQPNVVVPGFTRGPAPSPAAGPDGGIPGQARGDAGRRFGVALSGGPDSCALLVLAAAAMPGRVAALTVDHGFRPEAADEAGAAGRLCASLGVPHEIVRVAPVAATQAAARAARYGALERWAACTGLAAVLTGHHADDQAETMLMRLTRGSGVGGLAGIRAVQSFRRAQDRCRDDAGDAGLLVLRPPLAWRKAELVAVCAAAGVAPSVDPSNADPRFDRTRARALLAATDWIDAARLAASAAHLAEADAALDAVADERWAAAVADGPSLAPTGMREIDRRLLRRLLAERFDAHPDGPTLDRAQRALEAGGATTCADILCTVQGRVWCFRRAPPRARR